MNLSANPGWRFAPPNDGTFAVALKDNNSDRGPIQPYYWALVTGGYCDQATIEEDKGKIIEIWCVSSGCRFFVDAITDDEIIRWVIGSIIYFLVLTPTALLFKIGHLGKRERNTPVSNFFN